jgi:hypothetical protein
MTIQQFITLVGYGFLGGIFGMGIAVTGMWIASIITRKR